MPPIFNACKQYLNNHLSVERFCHSLNVCRMMEKLAAKYDLDPEAARWCGLMHDVAREQPDHELVRLLGKFYPESLEHLPERYRVGTYLHGPAGAVVMRKLWEYPHRGVMLAIEQHAGNYLDMPLLSRCLHLADLACPVMEYPGRAKLERELLAGRLDNADLLASTWLIEYFEEKGTPVHPCYYEKIRRLQTSIRPASNFAERLT